MACIRYEDFERDKVGAIGRLAEQFGLTAPHDILARVDVAYQPPGDRSVSWDRFFGLATLARIEAIGAEAMRERGYRSLAGHAPTQLEPGHRV